MAVPDCCLFPGHKISKGRELHRTWTQPITTRAFLYKIGEAAAILQRERANRHEEGFPSIWDDVDLSKLGTHNIKRTCVSLLKDQCRSGAVVSAICGTTAATLDRVYVGREQPSRLRWVLCWGLLNLRLHSAASVRSSGDVSHGFSAHIAGKSTSLTVSHRILDAFMPMQRVPTQAKQDVAGNQPTKTRHGLQS